MKNHGFKIYMSTNFSIEGGGKAAGCYRKCCELSGKFVYGQIDAEGVAISDEQGNRWECEQILSSQKDFADRSCDLFFFVLLEQNSTLLLNVLGTARALHRKATA